ncbi:MAG: GNAT family N-acetyltransferase [Pseudomonadota bacterium]
MFDRSSPYVLHNTGVVFRILEEEQPQLRMIWPTEGAHLSVIEPPAGYLVRQCGPGGEEPFFGLMVEGEFDAWNDAKLRSNVARVVPNGWFVAVHQQTQTVCGSVMCLHNYTGTRPYMGDLGWLACARAHRGHGIGACLTSHATARFLSAGYVDIQLHTESYRLAAIRIYLSLGYVPEISSERASGMWRDVCSRIHWAHTPDMWAERIKTRQRSPASVTE